MIDIIATEKQDENTETKVPPKELVTFAKNLRKYRAEHRYKQEDIAAMCGLHQRMISDIERCESNPTIKTLSAIAESIGVPLHELIKS